VSRRGDRRDRRLPAPRQRQPQQPEPLRHRPPHLGSRRGRPHDRGPLPRLLARRDGDRREHDHAQLRAQPCRRARIRGRDEIVVTRLDHDGSIAPWLELARDRDLVVRFADIDDGCRIDLADLEAQLSDRTRVVAFPLASNAVGTITDAARIVELAHGAGALAWADAVHYAAHLPIDVAALAVDVLLCSPYKFYGPHLGLAFARQELLERWRPYKVRPAPESPPGRRYETGTAAHELLAGFIAAVRYVESIGWDAIAEQEHTLGERFIAGLPDRCTLYGPATMDGRVSTFGFTVEGHTPLKVSEALGQRDVAVQYGDFYAIELPRRLELPEGLVRAGILHYTTADEVDRLLAGLDELF